MSMDAYALCNHPIPSMAEWQKSIDGLGFGLTLRSSRSIADLSGHLPATWRDHEAGFECAPFPADELGETSYEEIDFRGPWSHVYAFHYGTLAACIGAWIALAACAKLTRGMAYDPQQGLLLTADQAVRHARDGAASFDRIEAHLKGLAGEPH